ncbi:MAG: PAS domain S-box protein [Bradymonadaceae bacterium]
MSEQKSARPSESGDRSSPFPEAIVEAAHDGIVTIDRSGTVFTFNRAAEEIFGYDRDEVVGENVSMLMPEPHASNHDGYLQRYFETGEAHIIGTGREVEGRRKDGETFPLELAISEFESDGRTFFAGFVRDLTQAKRLEREVRQIQKSETIGRLTSGVAHDFNNVLMGISGHAQMAVKKVDPSHPIQRHLRGIEAAVTRGAGLTNRLLSFSRPAEGDGRPLEIDNVVEDLQQLIEPLVRGEDRIELSTDFGAPGAHVECQPSHLDQVVLNLVVNARDASQPGGEVELVTRTTALDDSRNPDVGLLPPGEYVVVEVADQGVGMEDETVERIFEPFFTTKPVGEGTGLGLSTVFGIVQEWDGAIEVETEPGEGTTFRVYLRRVERADTEAGGREEGEKRWSEGGGAPVLVAEDDARVRSALVEYLDDGGYNPIAAAEPAEALERADTRADLSAAVIDLTLGGSKLRGRQLADELSRQCDDLAILFMTGYTSLAANQEIQDADREILTKPFSKETLYEAMGELDAAADRRTDAGVRAGEDHRVLIVEDNELARHATSELLDDEGWSPISAGTVEEAVESARSVDAGLDVAIVDLTLPDGGGGELVEVLRSAVPQLSVVFVSGAEPREPAVVDMIETSPRTTFLQKPLDIDRLVAAMEKIRQV